MMKPHIIKSFPLYLLSILHGCGEERDGESSDPSLKDPYSLLRDFRDRAIGIIKGEKAQRVMRPHDPLIVRAGTLGKESVLCKWPRDQSGRTTSQGSSGGFNGYCAIVELEEGEIIRRGMVGLGEDASMWGITTGGMMPKGIRGFVGWTSPGEDGQLGRDYWYDFGIEWFIQPEGENREGYCDVIRWNDWDPYSVTRDIPEPGVRECYSWYNRAFGAILKIIAVGSSRPVERCLGCTEEPCTPTETTDIEVCKTTNPDYF